jgi:hypothetical protein
VATRAAQRCRTRLERICARLPEVDGRPGGDDDRHLGFAVRGKTFAWFTDDHHGDGRLALHCGAPPGLQAELVAVDPERYFVPPYLGARGWVGVDLDGAVDWDRVEALLTEAYRRVAPKRLAARLDDPGAR